MTAVCLDADSGLTVDLIRKGERVGVRITTARPSTPVALGIAAENRTARGAAEGLRCPARCAAASRWACGMTAPVTVAGLIAQQAREVTRPIPPAITTLDVVRMDRWWDSLIRLAGEPPSDPLEHIRWTFDMARQHRVALQMDEQHRRELGHAGQPSEEFLDSGQRFHLGDVAQQHAVRLRVPVDPAGQQRKRLLLTLTALAVGHAAARYARSRRDSR
jgi:hypothetical protein